MTDTQSLGSRLRERRLELGLSQKRLSDCSGVDRAVICRIEKGNTKTPSFATVYNICSALRLSMQWLGELTVDTNAD